jgi:hypothetical protein
MTPQAPPRKTPTDRLAFLEGLPAASPTMAALLNGETEIYDDIAPSVKQYLGYSAGCSAAGEARQVLDEGAVAFLQKPFQVRELSHRVFTP